MHHRTRPSLGLLLGAADLGHVAASAAGALVEGDRGSKGAGGHDDGQVGENDGQVAPHERMAALIDVSPDFRTQFLRHADEHIPEVVFLTHAHNDHIAGLGDYADLCVWNSVTGTIVAPPSVIAQVQTRYPYLQNRKSLQFIAADSWTLGRWSIQFHLVNHGHNGTSYGILFNLTGEGPSSYPSYRFAYVSDAINLTEDQKKPLQGVHLLILGTSYWTEQQVDIAKRSVHDVTEAIALRTELHVPHLLLTHLSHDIDVVTHGRQLPEEVRFATDGLRLRLPPAGRLG